MRKPANASLILIATILSIDDISAFQEIRREATQNQFRQQQGGRAGSRLGMIVAPASGQTNCPSTIALNLLKHEIAYNRTEELDPLRGLTLVHMRVWERGSLTAFFIDESLKTYPPNLRVAYFVYGDGTHGYFSCPAEDDWLKCIKASARQEEANKSERTCTATINLGTIPTWEPSPDSEEKRRIATELRLEIEAELPRAQEIVIRDFNLKDSQLIIYIKYPGGDFFQGCSFNAMRKPHCEGWRLFGMSSSSAIRKRIFDKPYRLK